MKRKKKKKYHKINKTTLKKLEKAGVPSHIIEKLRGMMNEQHENQQVFETRVETIIGAADFAQYRSEILKRTARYRRQKSKRKNVRLPRYKLEQSKKQEITANGGMFLLAELIKKTEMIESFNRIGIFLRQKITEAVHILTLAINQICGGDVVFDTRYIQQDQALKTIFGDIHIPAPHTSGDFLERFTEIYTEKLRAIIQKMQDKMLRKLRKKLGDKAEIIVSIDSTVYEIFGNTIENSAMSHKGIFGYHPLLMHLHNTGEMLDIYLRPGNVYTNSQAIDMIEHNIRRLAQNFDKIILLADSGFYDQKIIMALKNSEKRLKETYPDRSIKIQYIISAVKSNPLKQRLKSDDLTWITPEKAPEKQGIKRRDSHTIDYRLMDLKKNLRKHGKHLKIRGDVELTEFNYTVGSWGFASRFVFKRQKIEIENLSNQLDFLESESYFYHGYVTNIQDKEPYQIAALIDGRGHQEKFIEDYKNGLATTHIPTKHFYANYAYFLISMLSWNLKCWLLFIISPDKIMRWKRFRYLFVKVGAQIIKKGDYVIIRFGKGFERFREFWDIFHKIRKFQLEDC